MALMSSFCRITGHARNLPKPCYFPLLPPISPADAKKLCRITGFAADHNYSPIIAFAKPYRFDGLEGCKITKHESLSFSRPLFIKYKENEKTLDHLTQLLSRMKAKKKKKVDVKRIFVYKINDQAAGVAIPPELEEAIRTGEIENFSVSKDIKHMCVKIKQSRTVKVQMEPVPDSEVNVDDNYYYGEGQSKEVLEEQQKILNERNKRKQDTMARKKLFEQKEQIAEDELKKATERPKSKRPPVKFDPKKRREKLDKMTKLIEEQKENTAIILPKFDPVSKVNPDEQLCYEKMLEDIVKCQQKSFNVTTVFSANFDWAEMEKAESAGFDWESFPHEDVCEPVEVTIIDIKTKDFVNLPQSQSLDIAAAVETIDPAPEVEKDLLKAIKNIDGEKLKTTEKVSDAIKELESSDILPSINEVGKVISETENRSEGYLVKNKDGKGSRFVKKGEYTMESGPALSGAMITYENTHKFVPGIIVHLAQQESFVAGQTIDTPEGKHFIPGQTIINKNGDISFIPGHKIATEEGNTFVAGHTIEREDGPQFVAGQMVDLGDKKPVFMSGQTIITENGPKFVPGEVARDSEGYHEFVPGLKMPTSKGEKFIPGQAFQSDTGISFTPGQIIETEEGPSFVLGKRFETAEGNKKFVRGEMIKKDDGKISFEASMEEFEVPMIKEDLVESDDENIIIPNEDLQLLAVPGKDVAGFVVKPTNTSNIQVGEKLYGHIVETDTSVLFYLSGKLPNDDQCVNAKIISGQLTVGETAQKFVPGKMMNTKDGEKFIPGQIVKTNQGEEFVPGQMVETADGIKFIPGQIAMTSEGEKFIPGQVVLEEDGPRFVPGQIIQTKYGATFIPGQMMTTDKGQKFVPGQLVDTKEGPMFVPGQVVVTNEGPRFISGTVVETEDGLKYLPNVSTSTSTTEESEEDSEISFQGFDISPEEIQLLTMNVANARPRSPLRKAQGLIDSSTLKKLAADTMVIHGRTPEPSGDKKKKKKGKITIDALDEDEEKDSTETEDLGTDKVEILKVLLKAGTSLSSLRKEKELKKLGELLNIDDIYDENETEIEAIKFINSSNSSSFKQDFFELYIGNDEELVADILFSIGNVDNVQRNDQVTNIVNDAIKKIITKKCDEQIDQLISKINLNPESLFTDSSAQILLTEAVGIVCVTGDVEVASLLEKFISEPTDPNCLKEDKDVLAVLRQVLVLHRIAERDPEVARALQELRDDPEGVRDRNRIRKLIREAKSLLVREKKDSNKTFNVRHVTSSKDIPKEIFEQIRKDKDEADKFMEKLPDELFQAVISDDRCGGNFIKSLTTDTARRSSKEIDKFKRGMAVVVAKDNMEAVIPKHYARSIYYGIMPYLLIDEEGFKFFERGLTGRKLAPARVIENTWFQPDSYYEKGVLYPQRVTPSGMQYKLVLLGDSYRNNNNPSIQYTSLLPSSGPTRISYLESQRRASRDGSVTPLRRSSRSTTPSRRFSLSALHDAYSSGSDSFSRRHSMGTTKGLNSSEMNSDLVNSYTPKTSYISEEDLEMPVKRSGTIGRLLDKYSKYPSTDKYSKYSTNDNEDEDHPEKYEKYNPLKSYLQNGDDEKLNNFNYAPPSLKGRTSSITPDRSDEPSSSRYGKDRFTDIINDEVPLRGKKVAPRPFSDIYETDEIDSPTTEKKSFPRKSLLETAKKNYDALDSIYDESLKEKEGKLSYTDRLKEWKNRQNILSSYESEEKPSKSLRPRHGSILGEEDDRPMEEKNHPREKNHVKRPSQGRKEIDEDDADDFNLEKFRQSLREKYSQGLGELTRNLNIDYKAPSPTRPKVEKRGSLQPEDDILAISRKQKRYNRSISDSVGPREFGNAEDELGTNFRKASMDRDYDPYNIGEYRSPYGYGGGYGSSYEQPPLYGQPPMGYAQQNGGPMYGNSHLSSNRGYTGPPMYGGTGMGMYSPMSTYGAPAPSRFGGGGYNPPMGRYGSSAGPYSGYGRNSPSIGYGNTPRRQPYGAPNRRFTTALNLSDDDDDDDEDLRSYDPKRGQRQLASKIARKYVLDSDNDEDE